MYLHHTIDWSWCFFWRATVSVLTSEANLCFLFCNHHHLIVGGVALMAAVVCLCSDYWGRWRYFFTLTVSAAAGLRPPVTLHTCYECDVQCMVFGRQKLSPDQGWSPSLCSFIFVFLLERLLYADTHVAVCIRVKPIHIWEFSGYPHTLPQRLRCWDGDISRFLSTQINQGASNQFSLTSIWCLSCAFAYIAACLVPTQPIQAAFL